MLLLLLLLSAAIGEWTAASSTERGDDRRPLGGLVVCQREGAGVAEAEAEAEAEAKADAADDTEESADTGGETECSLTGRNERCGVTGVLRLTLSSDVIVA